MKCSNHINVREEGRESFGVSHPSWVAHCGAREPGAHPWKLCCFRLEPVPLQSTAGGWGGRAQGWDSHG